MVERLMAGPEDESMYSPLPEGVELSSSPLSMLGRVTINRVPPPSTFSARMAPPRRLTVSLTMLGWSC